MKKKQKKAKKNKKLEKKKSKFKNSKKLKKILKKRRKNPQKRTKRIKNKKPKNYKRKILLPRINKVQKESLALKLVRLQLSLKPQFNFKINFSLEKYIQGFFDKISDTISNYKI